MESDSEGGNGSGNKGVEILNWVDEILGNDLVNICFGIAQLFTLQGRTNNSPSLKIFRNVVGYLGIPDLKILRQTCKPMLNRVNVFRRFVNNLQITICQESIREEVFRHSTLYWRKAKLALECHDDSYDDSSFQAIKMCLIHVQDLEILLHTPRSYPEVVHQICDLILHAAHLKSLSVPVQFFSWENVLSKVSGKLSTLEGLCLCHHTIYIAAAMHKKPVPIINKHFYGYADLLPPRWKATLQNWPELGTLDWNLKYLQVDSIVSDHRQILDNILRTSTSTLTALIINCQDVVSFHIFEDLIFPCLKSIRYQLISPWVEEHFARFLRNQPRLESIEIIASQRTALMLRGSVIPKYISPKIMDAIREKSGQLKTLGFYGDWRESFGRSKDWEFLQQCKKLEKFRMSRGDLAPDLPHLPNNVESLHLFNLRTGRMDPVSLMEGFPHLTELKLGCQNALTDDILQAICRVNTALRIFHPGNMANVTDFGLTGELEDGHKNSGISLRNLKGLRELVIGGLEGVTMEGFVKAIWFKELRKLELICGLVPEGVVLEIAKNNPSLESLACSVGCLTSENTAVSLFSKIRAVNRRMTWLVTKMDTPTRLTTWKPSYGIPLIAQDSEFRIAESIGGGLVLTIFGSTEAETP